MAVAALGASVLLAWIFNITSLKIVIRGFVPMKANTALGMLLCGTALSLLTGKKKGHPDKFAFQSWAR